MPAGPEWCADHCPERSVPLGAGPGQEAGTLIHCRLLRGPSAMPGGHPSPSLLSCNSWALCGLRGMAVGIPATGTTMERTKDIVINWKRRVSLGIMCQEIM